VNPPPTLSTLKSPKVAIPENAGDDLVPSRKAPLGFRAGAGHFRRHHHSKYR